MAMQMRKPIKTAVLLRKMADILEKLEGKKGLPCSYVDLLMFNQSLDLESVTIGTLNFTIDSRVEMRLCDELAAWREHNA